MTSSSPSPTRPLGRIDALDVARGLAVISMVAAHFAPGAPLGALTSLSEWLTAALFALLIGAGAAGSRHRPLGRTLAIAAVRGLVLVLVGLWLESDPGQIDIVLVELGALTVVAPLLARLPSPLLATAAAALTLGAQFLIAPAQGLMLDLWRGGHPHLARVVEVAAGGVHYRLTTMLVHAALGVLVMRHLVGAPRGRTALVGAAAAALALCGLVGHRLGLVSSLPYSGTPTELAVSAGLSLLVTATCLLLVPGRAAAWAEPLRAAGTMAMSLYVLQVWGVATWLDTRPPGASDNSWALVGVSVLLILVLPVVWQRVTPWRGPLEALTDALVRPLRPARRDSVPLG